MRLPADVCSLKNKVQWVLALCNFWAWEKVALAKYLAYAFFGLFSSLLRLLAYFWPKNCSNEINSPKIALAKYALCALWENVLHEIHVSGTIGGPLVYQCQGNGIR